MTVCATTIPGLDLSVTTRRTALAGIPYLHHQIINRRGPADQAPGEIAGLCLYVAARPDLADADMACAHRDLVRVVEQGGAAADLVASVLTGMAVAL